MSNLLVLRRDVRNRVGIPIIDSFQGPEVIDSAINAAIRTIDSEHRWPWQERIDTSQTVVDQASVTMPADWRTTRAVYIGDVEVQQRSPGDLYLWSADDRGRPQIWSLIGGNIYLRPIPDQAYTVTHLYYKTPTLLVEDVDVPDVPQHHEDAIVAKAAELLSIREDDRAAAQAHLAEYLTAIARMRKDVRRSTGPIRIRVREGSWI